MAGPSNRSTSDSLCTVMDVIYRHWPLALHWHLQRCGWCLWLLLLCYLAKKLASTTWCQQRPPTTDDICYLSTTGRSLKQGKFATAAARLCSYSLLLPELLLLLLFCWVVMLVVLFVLCCFLIAVDDKCCHECILSLSTLVRPTVEVNSKQTCEICLVICYLHVDLDCTWLLSR